jgi:hypothetical protein
METGFQNMTRLSAMELAIPSQTPTQTEFPISRNVDLTLDPLAGLGDFSSANDWGTGWKELSGFGYYFESSKPWYFHKGMGWFYAQELDFSNLWVHFTNYGWCWTSQNIFPFFYQDKEKNWIHYSSSNSNSFYRYQNNAWTLIE